ncbi:MAG TPA: ABC transporter ATP-binding protein [Steroidobacteraceae bacterium]|jgi:lipopolysaccharide transport system ATP-binding protein|nr:ABC transporter ATP-binding protein [Steroidobacteraceae bacterium]
MAFAIKMEGLGKRYRLAHKHKARYRSLRDSIVEGALDIGYATKRLLTRKIPSTRPADEDFWALKDVDLQIEQGERLAIIGRNGAGKSTMLKLLSRVVEPTSGRAALRGRLASLLEVGTGFHPELTGRENIYLNGAILGMGRQEIDRKFDEIVSFADVEKFLDTPVKRFSSGMYTRLAFSVAAHLETDILIVDEVLAVGDAAFQRKCLGKMGDISEQGRTLLFVSHNMAAVQTLCNRAVLLSGGKIVATGDTHHIIEAYTKSWRQNIDLGERRDRSGTRRARLQSIALEDSNGDRSLRVGSMQAFEFVVTVSAEPDAIGKKADLILIVCDRRDNRMVPLYTEWTQSDFRITAEQQTFRCRVAAGLPLVADTYWLTAAVLIGGVNADKLERALEFEVTPSQDFAAGLVLNPAYGQVLVEHVWEQARA